MFFNLLKHIFTIKKCKLLSDSFSDVKQDVFDKISEVYSIQFSSISGTLRTDSNFTPEYSIKLYKKFNNYIFGNYKLRLDICDIKKRELLHTLILL